MTTVQLPSGETIWYRSQGSGPPLLHIHGSAFGHRNFEKLTPHMAEHFEVIDFDLPGYGESIGAPAVDLAGIGEQVFGFIRALGHERLHVHGTSFGAMIGVNLAAHHPEVIDRLVFSCFLARYDNAARMMRGTWKRAARDSGMEAVADLTSVAGFARAFYDRPEAAAQLASMREAFSHTLPAAFVTGTEAIEKTDLTPLIPRIEARTLLLAGAEDNMTPLAPAASGVGFSRIETMLPSAELRVIPDCGHYLVIEQPELARDAIVEFLNR
jgi:pimeloyl-ACP methyl ester carboxylesterase